MSNIYKKQQILYNKLELGDDMKALITGASSGIGRDMAKELVSRGYEVILVARRKEKLEKIASELNGKAKIISMDISNTSNCRKLYEQLKNEDIDILINNAGFGIFGKFDQTNLDKELEMIDVNVKAVHVLTKLFLQDFKKKDKGYILNVASSAGFLPGPLMATYYSSKAYVLNLTEAIYGELKKDKSNVHISVLCPGPVDTEFNSVAGVTFHTKSLSSNKVASYAINKMFKKKMIIIPGLYMKIAIFFMRFAPRKMLLNIAHDIQSKKRK